MWEENWQVHVENLFWKERWKKKDYDKEKYFVEDEKAEEFPMELRLNEGKQDK